MTTVLNSNLDPKFGYPDRGFAYSSSVFPS